MSWIILGSLLAHDTAAQPQDGPAKVEIKQIGGRYQLLRNGRPYYIQGAGLEFGNIDKLAEHGGNSFRTWRTENGQRSAQDILDHAQRCGLTVSMCLEIGKERHGFNYDDETAVARQFATVQAEVMKYKDHPALLMWIIGNELNLSASNPRVWDAVNDISKMIHEVDPNHLTTTALAGIGSELIRELRQRAPDLDLLAIQMYADLINLAKVPGRDRLGRSVRRQRMGSDGSLGGGEDSLGSSDREQQHRQGRPVPPTLRVSDRDRPRTMCGFLRVPVGAETGTHPHLVWHVPGIR